MSLCAHCSYLQEYPLILVGTISLIISSGSSAVAPYLFGKVVDYAMPDQTNWYVTSDMGWHWREHIMKI